MATKAINETIEVPSIETASVVLWLVGVTPLILQRMSVKAEHELLAPYKKSASERASSLKHDPLAEFRASPHTIQDGTAPTLLAITGVSVKKAMAAVAVDLPGAVRKAQIGRLSWVEGEYIGIYGKPLLHMATVRMADINHTPDIRTRAIVPNWATQVTISFVTPLMKPQSIYNLVQAAGIINGLGEWRNQHGSGTYGQFRLASESAEDRRFIEDIQKDGRAVQVAAMQNPEAYDADTAETLKWFEGERKRRGFAA